MYENEHGVETLSQENECGAEARGRARVRDTSVRGRVQGLRRCHGRASVVPRCYPEKASTGLTSCRKMASMGPGRCHESVGEGIMDYDGRTQKE